MPGVRFPLGACFLSSQILYVQLSCVTPEVHVAARIISSMRKFTLPAAYFLLKNHHLALVLFASFPGDWRKSDAGLLDSTHRY